MKTRTSFVSNSSSSSFIIRKSDLTAIQIQQIKDHEYFGKQLNLEYADSPWDIEVDQYWVKGFTWMDNFDMKTYLHLIGVNEDLVQWSGENS